MRLRICLGMGRRTSQSIWTGIEFCRTAGHFNPYSELLFEREANVKNLRIKTNYEELTVVHLPLSLPDFVSTTFGVCPALVPLLFSSSGVEFESFRRASPR